MAPPDKGRQRLPTWLRAPLTEAGSAASVHAVLEGCSLHTVCESARCPNRPSCWSRGTATFMILGDRCTRHCSFCAVNHASPLPPDPDEPLRVAEAAKRMRLHHAVVTSVTRDDLPDGGAELFAATIEALRSACPNASIEVLIPDLNGSVSALDRILTAGPDVLNHNLETVRRLQAVIRPQASYERSLEVLGRAAGHPAFRGIVKTGFMLGMGETDVELIEALRDACEAGCRMVTMGQYLAPGLEGYHPVDRFVPPDGFDRLAREARRIGFAAVAAAPLVRSSYQAADLLAALHRVDNPAGAGRGGEGATG